MHCLHGCLGGRFWAELLSDMGDMYVPEKMESCGEKNVCVCVCVCERE